jgi:DUF4097 and DUF4098 domain-containing protein YvlB
MQMEVLVMKKLIVIITLSVALLCLCAAMLGIFWFSIRQIGFSGVSFRPVSVGAEATEEKRLAVDGPANLDVKNSYGNIRINAADVNEITISMHKMAYAENEAKAQEALEKMNVSITQDGNSIQVAFEQQQGVQMGVVGVFESDRVDFTIQVPTETQVTAYSSSGDVSLSGTRGEASLKSDYGDISAAKTTGSLSASTSSGKVEASDIQAGEANIELKSEYGNISLENASADGIELNSSSGNLTLENVDASGKVSLNSDYGTINFKDGSAKSLTITAKSGKIGLANLEISGDLKATGDYGDIDLEQVAADSYDLNTSSGAVTVEGASGSIKAHSGYGNVNVIGGEQATLDLSTSSGTVEFTGTLGEGPHTLKSDYGSITLTIPAETTLELDLKTDYGSVKSAIPVTLSGDLKEDHWVGSINGGGESLTVSTSSGNIRIEILNP